MRTRTTFLLFVVQSASAARGRCNIKVESVAPHLGHYERGIILNVSGTDFTPAYGDVRCRFGATTWTEATVGSSTHLLCHTPDLSPELQVKAAGGGGGGVAMVPLEVTLNGPDYSSSGVLFTVFDLHAANISAVVPSGGPSSGVTSVTVHGANFRGLALLKPNPNPNPNPDQGSAADAHYRLGLRRRDSAGEARDRM